jgi:hypothetical protein
MAEQLWLLLRRTFERNATRQDSGGTRDLEDAALDRELDALHARLLGFS